MFDLRGRVALVTSASTGLGQRFAPVLHAEGATVVITARRADRLRDLGDELGSDCIGASSYTTGHTLTVDGGWTAA